LLFFTFILAYKVISYLIKLLVAATAAPKKKKADGTFEEDNHTN
jgi:hypothetical protein